MADFGGNPSIWNSSLGKYVVTGWPDSYANLCVYPYNSSYAGYIHPVSWFQEQTDKNLGNPGTCSLFAGDPVNTGTGNTFETDLDLSVATPGIPLEFVRYYNSQALADHPLGYGWTHTYDMALQVIQTTPSRRVKIRNADGRYLYFSQISQTYPDGTHLYGESGVRDRLTLVASGEYLLRRKDNDLTYRFGTDGRLSEITDPNGNALTLTYTGGLLTGVVSSFGAGITLQYQGTHISSVLDPKGQPITYQYSNGDLVLVSYPDSRSMSYSYASHRLTDKRDTAGNEIGHWSYDADGRVSTNYRYLENGVPQEQIDFAYNLTANPQTTTLTRSTGTTTYTLGLIDGMRVVSALDGCPSCGGGLHKSFRYDSRLELTDVTSTSEGNPYTTHYTYDAPANSWDVVGEITGVRKAVGWPEEQLTSYAYTHRSDDPFLLSQSTVSRPSAVNPSQSSTVTTTYEAHAKVQSRSETGYVLVNGTPV